MSHPATEHFLETAEEAKEEEKQRDVREFQRLLNNLSKTAAKLGQSVKLWPSLRLDKNNDDKPF